MADCHPMAASLGGGHDLVPDEMRVISRSETPLWGSTHRGALDVRWGCYVATDMVNRMLVGSGGTELTEAL